MNTPSDPDIITAMKRYGGSFASSLAVAARYADSENLARIKEAFPELWARYSEMAGNYAHGRDVYQIANLP